MRNLKSGVAYKKMCTLRQKWEFGGIFCPGGRRFGKNLSGGGGVATYNSRNC